MGAPIHAQKLTSFTESHNDALPTSAV